MGWLFATLLSKTDFSFAILLATFEPLEIYQSYIPFWKAQECGINAWEAQGRGCMFILRQTSLKMAILLHTVANWRFIMIIAVYDKLYFWKFILWGLWNWTTLDTTGDSHSPSQLKNKNLHHSRNFKGQNHSHHSVLCQNTRPWALQHFLISAIA